MKRTVIARTKRRLARCWPLIAAGIVVAPVVVRTPPPQVLEPDGVRTLDDAVQVSRATGLRRWDLVAYAQRLVFEKFSRYSILSVWEPPELAFRNSRGYCNQYNTALWVVLRELGFDAERVFATRVRQDLNPWWRMGHMWVQVTIDGRTLDVCAGRADNRPGKVGFIPVTEVLPFDRETYWHTTAGMVLFTVATVWRSVLTGKPLPRWAEREFGSKVSAE